MIKNSCLASIFIGFGVAILLSIGNPIGPFLFSFGLLSVCVFGADLFTGKAGYYWRTKPKELFFILCLNLIFGWIMGFLMGYAYPNIVPVALEKISTWTFDCAYFIKSVFCGMIMYICVELYKRGNIYGIFYGIPLFIFNGFQHCIANIIILGVAETFSNTIFLCILGNLIGSMIINILQEVNKK